MTQHILSEENTYVSYLPLTIYVYGPTPSRKQNNNNLLIPFVLCIASIHSMSLIMVSGWFANIILSYMHYTHYVHTNGSML